jgi:hypothetical protein
VDSVILAPNLFYLIRRKCTPISPNHRPAQSRFDNAIHFPAAPSGSTRPASESRPLYMASRVPLLVKSKGRKPSRVSIAPRAKPSNGAFAAENPRKLRIF